MTLEGLRRGIAEVTIEASDRRDESVSQTSVVTVGGPALVPLFPAAADPMREGFLRVINHGPEEGETRIPATDDYGMTADPVTLALDANEATHFNSTDLEGGNAAKGLTGSAGPGQGDWRLVLTSDPDVEVLSYVRTEDGFLNAMHDVLRPVLAVHRIPTVSPGSNPNQVSYLRLVNYDGHAEAAVTITGMDDAGESPGTNVAVTLPASTARTLSAAKLEAGAEGMDGALGDGKGKWRLTVRSEAPVAVMSLLRSPTGHLTNLSTAPDRTGY